MVLAVPYGVAITLVGPFIAPIGFRLIDESFCEAQKCAFTPNAILSNFVVTYKLALASLASAHHS